MRRPTVMVFGRKREDGIVDEILIERVLRGQGRWSQLNAEEREAAFLAWAQARRDHGEPVTASAFANRYRANVDDISAYQKGSAIAGHALAA